MVVASSSFPVLLTSDTLSLSQSVCQLILQHMFLSQKCFTLEENQVERILRFGIWELGSC